MNIIYIINTCAPDFQVHFLEAPLSPKLYNCTTAAAAYIQNNTAARARVIIPSLKSIYIYNYN